MKKVFFLLPPLLILPLILPILLNTNVTAVQEEEEHEHDVARYGYIGLEPGDEVDPHELEEFQERVQVEAYAKADIDKIRFVIMAILFALAYLAFAKIKGVSEKLRAVFDWYTLGTVTALILVGLVIPSGIIITFYYNPLPTEVYSSVEAMTQSSTLAFFRNLHNWSSELFLILMLLHAARTISTRTYLGKRKIIWLTGALVFVFGWLAFVSGTFMRGDQEALEGFEHIMFASTLVPMGNYVADFFSGELAVMKLTASHIGLTTFLIVLLSAPHILMRKEYLHVLKRWKKAVMYSVVLTGFLIIQSLLMETPFVRGFDTEGPTLTGIETTKPPWPIYFLVTGENLIGAATMVITPVLIFLPFLLFPYIVERFPWSNEKRTRAGELFYYAGTYFILVISYWAATSAIITHIF
jgi:quinol-cytochrome oxidoreductase complex cytochrome b subunit